MWIEIVFYFFLLLVEASVWLVVLAVAPLRFVFSAQYRSATRQRWRGDRGRCVAELSGGTMVLLLFVGMLSWWTCCVYRATRPAPPRRQAVAALEREFQEKVRAIRRHYRH